MPEVSGQYVYDPAANPNKETLPGVPLRTLSAAEVEALPPHLKRSLAACPFYKPAGVAAAGALMRTSYRRETKAPPPEAETQ